MPIGNNEGGSVAVIGNNLFAGFYQSTNDGNNWTLDTTGNGSGFITSFAGSGTNVFRGERTGIYLSTNNGTSWTEDGLNGQWVSALAISGNSIYAGSDSGVFLSTNNGSNWSTINNGLSINYVFTVNSFAVIGANIFISVQVLTALGFTVPQIVAQIGPVSHFLHQMHLQFTETIFLLLQFRGFHAPQIMEQVGMILTTVYQELHQQH